MNLYAPSGSRKLTGLIIVLGALVVITIVAVLAIAIWDVDWQVFASAYTSVTTIGGAHQGAQAMADRSAYYQSPTPSQAPSAPPGGPRIP